jgi:hypothetical protein
LLPLWQSFSLWLLFSILQSGACTDTSESCSLPLPVFFNA